MWRLTCATVAALVVGGGPITAQALPDTVMTSEEGVRFRIEPILSELEGPAAMAFLPDGRLLLAERPVMRLSIVSPDTRQRTEVAGLPDAFHGPLGSGLHDVAVHPDFERNRTLYISWTAGDSAANALVVSRARLEGDRLSGLEEIFRAGPARDTADHYGGQLLLVDGYLFVTAGDHHDRTLAQNLTAHPGKVIRLHEDGGVPEDNPFSGQAGARAEVWTWGHRNPLGIARDPATGDVWINENGPLGGDELNLLRAGANYGWPRITWGREYSGNPVGAGARRGAGLEQPRYVLPRPTAPSGLVFYSGAAFPEWRGDLFSGAMAGRRLDRLVLEEGRVLRHEVLLDELQMRVRSLEEGPEGFLYVGVDEGWLFRLRPASR